MVQLNIALRREVNFLPAMTSDQRVILLKLRQFRLFIKRGKLPFTDSESVIKNRMKTAELLLCVKLFLDKRSVQLTFEAWV
jgi:hypothetical protein